MSEDTSVNCEFLLDDGGCDLGQKDGCVVTTEDQKCGFVIHTASTNSEE